MEARRAELHARLDRVLVVDARFPWNGVGNSLVRWLTLLRVGLASGRATFLWLSDFPESGLEQVLLRFKTATVQFRQESYGAYRPRPAAQLLSVHPGYSGRRGRAA